MTHPMTNEVVSRTAYYILSQSGDFAGQAYHTIVYQWIYVLKAQGVPNDHVFASVTTIEEVSLANPKPSLTNAKLSAPRGWEVRLGVSSEPLSWLPTFLDSLSDWGDDPAIDRVVLILVGPDIHSSKLCRDGLEPGLFEPLHTYCRNKPMLVVLDFDDSGQFADVAAKTTTGNIFFLASGRCRSQKTAAVLCDDADVDTIPVAPGPYSLRYVIYSTMFHRRFFDLVVFSSHDPTLVEIGDLMNAADVKCRGFEAVLVSSGPVSDSLHLRIFFGGPPDVEKLTGILAARPTHGFIDDIDYFVQEDTAAGLEPSPNEFVQFRLNGTEFELIDRGQFRSKDRYHERFRLHIEYGQFLKPRVTDPVPMSILVGEVVDRLCMDGFVARRDRNVKLSEEKSKISPSIHLFLLRDSGYGSIGWEHLNNFIPYLECRELSEWYRRLRAALDSISNSFPEGGCDANSCAWDDSSDDDATHPSAGSGTDSGTGSESANESEATDSTVAAAETKTQTKSKPDPAGGASREAACRPSENE